MISADKISQLREEMRRGRTGQTGGTSEVDTGNGRDQTGTDFQATGRTLDRVSGTSGKSESDSGAAGTLESSPVAKSVRKRPPDRRPGKSDGSIDQATSSDGETKRSVGNLFTEEPIKERLDPKPQAKLPTGKPKEEEKKKVSTPFSVFSEKEATQVKEELTAKLESHFESLDQYLWERQKLKFGASSEEAIWSNLDEEEIGALTGIWVKWGKKNPYVAEAARAAIEYSDYVQVGILFYPRIRKTVMIMRETYIPIQRKKKSDAA